MEHVQSLFLTEAQLKDGLMHPPRPHPHFLKCLDYNADGVVALTAGGRVGGPKSLHSRLNIMDVIGA